MAQSRSQCCYSIIVVTVANSFAKQTHPHSYNICDYSLPVSCLMRFSVTTRPEPLHPPPVPFIRKRFVIKPITFNPRAREPTTPLGTTVD